MDCPKCESEGIPVKNCTVRGVVLFSISHDVGDGDYYLCTNPYCGVGYYNEDAIIDKHHFKRPIWFKEGSDPVYACYCNDITEEDVVRAVVENGLHDMRSISIYLRGSVGGKCRVNNPTGRCCADAFGDIIKKALYIRSVLIKYSGLKVDSRLPMAPQEKGEECGCGGRNGKSTSRRDR